MDEFNPYQPPAAPVLDLEGGPASVQLATRGLRLGAYLLDGLISGLVSVLPIWWFYLAMGHSFRQPVHGWAGVPLGLGSVLIAETIYIVINGSLLARKGQSVGKYILDIKIVKQDGTLPPLVDSFLKRHVLIAALGQVPVVGPLFAVLDGLMIFRANRHCLHDDFAGTMVVKS